MTVRLSVQDISKRCFHDTLNTWTTSEIEVTSPRCFFFFCTSSSFFLTRSTSTSFVWRDTSHKTAKRENTMMWRRSLCLIWALQGFRQAAALTLSNKQLTSVPSTGFRGDGLRRRGASRESGPNPLGLRMALTASDEAFSIESLPPIPQGAHRVVFMRHGESLFDCGNLFTGWYDADLSPRGVVEAVEAGEVLRSHNLSFRKCYTSALSRAQKSAQRSLAAAGISSTPLESHWRINERHYGWLQGLGKERAVDRFGRDVVMQWRRSFSIKPPLMTKEHPQFHDISVDKRYRDLNGDIPKGESLQECQLRVLQSWKDITADFSQVRDESQSNCSLYVGHTNSLRALVMHLDNIAPSDISDLNIPRAVPFWYDINKTTGKVVSNRNDNAFRGVYFSDERRKRICLERRRTAYDRWLWALNDDQMALGRHLELEAMGQDDPTQLIGLRGIEEEARYNTNLFSSLTTSDEFDVQVVESPTSATSQFQGARTANDKENRYASNKTGRGSIHFPPSPTFLSNNPNDRDIYRKGSSPTFQQKKVSAGATTSQSLYAGTESMPVDKKVTDRNSSQGKPLPTTQAFYASVLQQKEPASVVPKKTDVLPTANIQPSTWASKSALADDKTLEIYGFLESASDAKQASGKDKATLLLESVESLREAKKNNNPVSMKVEGNPGRNRYYSSPTTLDPADPPSLSGPSKSIDMDSSTRKFGSNTGTPNSKPANDRAMEIFQYLEESTEMDNGSGKDKATLLLQYLQTSRKRKGSAKQAESSSSPLGYDPAENMVRNEKTNKTRRPSTVSNPWRGPGTEQESGIPPVQVAGGDNETSTFSGKVPSDMFAVQYQLPPFFQGSSKETAPLLSSKSWKTKTESRTFRVNGAPDMFPLQYQLPPFYQGNSEETSSLLSRMSWRTKDESATDNVARFFRIFNKQLSL